MCLQPVDTPAAPSERRISGSDPAGGSVGQWKDRRKDRKILWIEVVGSTFLPPNSAELT